MDEIDVMWDRLTGGLMLYIENFELKKCSGVGRFNLNPSYKVDYEIADEILEYLEKTTEEENIDSYWHMQIGSCRNINNLPPYLQQLVIQFLPRFLAQYPQYKDAKCLKIE